MALLYRVLVVQFYKANGGFFLFIFFVLFAVVDPGQVVSYHLALMQLILGSVTGMLLGMAAWIFYAYKCVAFMQEHIGKQENIFLMNLQGLPRIRQVFLLFCCHLILFLPVLAYAGFTITLGFRTGLINSAIILLLFGVLLCIGCTYLYFRRINGFHSENIKLRVDLPFKFTFAKPAILYPVFYVFFERKLAWLALKAFSFFVFYLIFILHEGNFSLAYFRLLFLIITITHSMLVYYSFGFMEKQLAFSRNLPVTRTSRLLSYLLTYALILLPEFCWMLSYTGSILSVPGMLLTVAAGLGQLLLLTAILYLPEMNLQRFTWLTSLVYFLTAILLPSGIAVVILSEIILALFIFYRHYYTFEYSESGS